MNPPPLSLLCRGSQTSTIPGISLVLFVLTCTLLPKGNFSWDFVVLFRTNFLCWEINKKQSRIWMSPKSITDTIPNKLFPVNTQSQINDQAFLYCSSGRCGVQEPSRLSEGSCLWPVGLGWQPRLHAATRSVHPLNRTRREMGKTRVRNLTVWDNNKGDHLPITVVGKTDSTSGN